MLTSLIFLQALRNKINVLVEYSSLEDGLHEPQEALSPSYIRRKQRPKSQLQRNQPFEISWKLFSNAIPPAVLKQLFPQ